MAIQRSGTRLTWFIYHLTGRLNVQVWCRCFQIASICLRCFLLLLLCVSWLEHTTVLMPSTFSSSVYCITCMLVHIIGDTNKTGTRPLKQCLLVLHMKYHQIQLRCSDVTKWLKNTIKFIYIYIYMYHYIFIIWVPGGRGILLFESQTWNGWVNLISKTFLQAQTINQPSTCTAGAKSKERN